MRFGIMQGRLSRPQQGRLQFFPHDWAAEFPLVRKLGFETLEWIYDDPVKSNPLSYIGGRAAIRALGEEYGVAIDSICADIFMSQSLVTENPSAIDSFRNLLAWSEEIGATKVGVPCLEEHAPVNGSRQEALVKNIKEALSGSHGAAELVLELEAPVGDMLSILERIGSPRVGICYDTGNAMTAGFNAGVDIRALGSHLKEIHFKDRIRHTATSVYLGEGDVDFPDVAKALREVGFQGLAVLQAWRSEDYLGDAARQLKFVKQLVNPA